MDKNIDKKERNALSPLAAWAKRRALVSRLSGLDNRMLDDIGIQRFQIAEVAERAFPRADLKASVNAYMTALVASIRTYLKQRDSARQLAALDDRMLADIGLRRSEIPGAIRGDLAFRAFAVPNIVNPSRAKPVHSVPDLAPASMPHPVNDDKRPIAA